ncbi:sulfur carrier protein ThiS [Pelobacter propionicus]|jgi:sulfur carrier protein|uniref:Sulfur carrier protein ThiS n=1 Tax=Pelobacter propionicus (strain DSM 2379 / NBRC 103807 / OttBd1) TaxID=338966 RepID=A1AUP6_PELPD|nr:sulfur carrier protein ThiS [Pelobacter propionicus]ABL01067.1 sulfur carrier protein ThiS [Pelobacter propionicus DSM 2379]
MIITVNGKATDVKDGCTIGQLLEQLEIKRDRVAVEVNLDIVPKASHDSHALAAGDVIEIVQFVGGG